MEVTAPRPLERQEKLWALVLAAAVLMLGSWWMIVGVCGVFHDDAIYVITAKALASGQGYRLINLPNGPPQTKYPILYPALLAAIWKIWPSFPRNLLAMQALSLLAGAATVGFSFCYLVRFGYCSRNIALASGLLCATSVNFLYFATLTLSEIPFALILLMALWGLEEFVRKPAPPWFGQVFLGVLLALPYLCRSLGLTLIPVGLLIWKRQGRPARWVALGAAALVIPWVVWFMMGQIPWRDDQVIGWYTNYLGWWHYFGLTYLMRVIFYNFISAMLCSIELVLTGLAAALILLKIPLFSFFLFLLGIIVWLFIAKEAWQGQILPLYLASYLGIILLWPWPPSRFIVPVMGFIFPFILLMIKALTGRLDFMAGSRILKLAGIGFLLVANMGVVVYYGRINHINGYPWYPVSGVADSPVQWSSFEGVLQWLKEHVQPEEVIAAGLDSMVALYTGKRAFRPFVGRPVALFYGHKSQPLVGVEELREILIKEQTRYLVHTPLPGFREEKPFARIIKELRQKYPHWLHPVYIGTDQRFVIFQLKPDLHQK